MADDEVPQPKPQPKYGELAPEGWEWPPPASDHGSGSTHTADTTARRKPTQHAQGQRPLGSRPRRTAPSWDRPVTLLLLVVGILGMFVNIAVITSAPQSMSALYASEGLGSYAMAATVPGIMAAASVVQPVAYVATAAVSIMLLVKRRRAFWMPLVGGVVAALANLAFMTAIVATDQTLLQHYAGL